MTSEPDHASSGAGPAENDAIAIIGMACRLPQAPDPDAFWRLLRDGISAIAEVPADRWDPDALLDLDISPPTRSALRYGGFLDRIDSFDPGFFGISPREAVAMDPQQRLMLELSWEALEDAGIVAGDLRGSSTGVFVGTIWDDYAYLLYQGGPTAVTQHTFTGLHRGIIANRVSYTLGVHGPSLTVDAVQSSALVAVHMACESLRQGESTLAIAGGVNLDIIPETTLSAARFGGLSPDGRCFTFDARANGFVRGEGGGTVVLKPLARAVADGDPIYCVIRGTAVNNDGTGEGLVIPNPAAQAAVLRLAYQRAGVRPADVQYVELHGTGTPTGDPLEAAALGAVFSAFRNAASPLLVGSAKTNVGHLEGAAGVVGLLKAALSIKHRQIAPSLNFKTPNPDIPLDELHLRVQDSLTAWPRGDEPLVAGVSSFGVGGTNCHAVLSEPPAGREPARQPPDVPPAVPWVISGRSQHALEAQARRLTAHLTEFPHLGVTDVGFSLATTRTAFEHRAVVVAPDREELLLGLDALVRDQPAASLVRGVAADPAKIVFVFPGQGSQWPGMAVQLLDTSAVFREHMLACEEALAPHVDWSLIGVLRGAPTEPPLVRDDIIEPVLFAVMVSLARLWQSAGVQPAAIVGHSQGEIAAACVAGALSLPDAARIVVLWSRTLAALAGSGAMASIQLPTAAVRGRLDRWGNRLVIAGVNGPRSTVVSGDPDAVAELVADCRAGDIRARKIDVEYACHSPHVEAVRDQLVDALSDVAPHASDVPFYSAVTGGLLDTRELNAEYWYRNARQTVQLEQTIQTVREHGYRFFIEVSPHPLLTVDIQQTLDAAEAPGAGSTPVIVGSLRRDDGGWDRFLTSLGQVFVAGGNVDWRAVFAGTQARRVALPTYAFQRQRYWLDAPAAGTAETSDGGPTQVEAQFWAAVDQEDLPALAATLEAGEGQRPSLGEVLPVLSAWHRQRRRQATVEGWRYRVVWRPVAADPAPVLSGTWLVAVMAGRADNQLAASLVKGLAGHGGRPVLFEVDRSADHAEVARHLAATAAERSAADAAVTGVLSLLMLDNDGDPEHATFPVRLALTAALAQALESAGLEAALWCVTRGAVSVRRSDPPPIPTQAGMWGLGAAVAQEAPAHWGGLVDLPVEIDGGIAAHLASILAGLDGENQVAVRPSGVFARRLVRARATAIPAPQARARGGTVLITGGTSGTGAAVARWLADNGAEHLILTEDRGSAAPGDDVELAADLAGLGVRVTVADGDVADRDALAEMLADVPADHPLTAVVHTTGMSDDAALDALTSERLAGALRPSLCAAVNLHELTREEDLSAFVLLSSLTATVGGPGRGADGAASAFLAALAEQRHAQGLPALALASAPWSGGDQEAWHGLSPLPPELALTALQQALGRDETCPVVADVDWGQLAENLASARQSPLLRELPYARRLPEQAGAGTTEGSSAEGSSAEPSSWARRLAGLSEAGQNSTLLELLRANVAIALGHVTPDAIDSGRPFKDLGFDSLTSVELSNRLNAATGLRLPVSLVYDYPTPTALVRHMCEELSGRRREVTVTKGAVAADSEPIAIVGMSCRYPGGADSPDQLWQLIAEGRDAVAGFPADRDWDVEGLYDPDPDEPGKSYAREGGFVYDADAFDPAFFEISPGRLQPWIRSSGCCWSRPGRRWSAPDSTPRR